MVRQGIALKIVEDKQVHGILESVSPVVFLVHTLGIGLGERRVVVQGGDGHGELAHWMEGGRASVDDFLDKLGESATGGPILGEFGNLLGGRDLASEEEPEETLW